MKHFLITGGAGFIGSHLTEALLAQGHQVSVIDNFNDYYEPERKRDNLRGALQQEKFRLWEGDICEEAFLQRVLCSNTYDAVVHLAARAGVGPSLRQPVLYQQVNIGGTQMVLEGCRQAGVRKVVFASSSSVYGGNREAPFCEEHSVARPISPYAATKAAGELLGYTYSHLYDMQVLCLRFFTVYGPRQRPDMAIHRFALQLLNKQAVTLHGDGSMRRDFTYIDDIVAGIQGALQYEKSKYEVINLGNSRTVSLVELLQLLERILGTKAVIQYKPVPPGDMQETYADISKAQRLLQYEPHTGLEAGLKAFAAWLQAKGVSY
ncbi:GDP-mannose 4,6-dehydratase [Anaeromusa sp.]|uniref:GDP-mannose 4,6-dehydratase n=1 Tax=Anaeromusa sp. TaxID=1872520 RepID=UPI002616AC2B|nr:GDP-mannose 4,6-dehydratase [Anaeromusa sp.]MDD3158149.1 GDP-mannose 4,6-dehydratase [Anaeromusa sp.]